jgi:hypothetical protein
MNLVLETIPEKYAKARSKLKADDGMWPGLALCLDGHHSAMALNSTDLVGWSMPSAFRTKSPAKLPPHYAAVSTSILPD